MLEILKSTQLLTIQKFKKSAVDEYEKAILSPAYLQSKKRRGFKKKYNLNSQQFTQWINLLGQYYS